MLSACLLSPSDLILFASEGPPPGGVNSLCTKMNVCYFLKPLLLPEKWLSEAMKYWLGSFDPYCSSIALKVDPNPHFSMRIWPRYKTVHMPSIGQNTYRNMCLKLFQKWMHCRKTSLVIGIESSLMKMIRCQSKGNDSIISKWIM